MLARPPESRLGDPDPVREPGFSIRLHRGRSESSRTEEVGMKTGGLGWVGEWWGGGRGLG